MRIETLTKLFATILIVVPTIAYSGDGPKERQLEPAPKKYASKYEEELDKTYGFSIKDYERYNPYQNVKRTILETTSDIVIEGCLVFPEGIHITCNNLVLFGSIEASIIQINAKSILAVNKNTHRSFKFPLTLPGVSTPLYTQVSDIDVYNLVSADKKKLKDSSNVIPEPLFYKMCFDDSLVNESGSLKGNFIDIKVSDNFIGLSNSIIGCREVNISAGKAMHLDTKSYSTRHVGPGIGDRYYYPTGKYLGPLCMVLGKKIYLNAPQSEIGRVEIHTGAFAALVWKDEDEEDESEDNSEDELQNDLDDLDVITNRTASLAIAKQD